MKACSWCRSHAPHHMPARTHPCTTHLAASGSFTCTPNSNQKEAMRAAWCVWRSHSRKDAYTAAPSAPAAASPNAPATHTSQTSIPALRALPCCVAVWRRTAAGNRCCHRAVGNYSRRHRRPAYAAPCCHPSDLQRCGGADRQRPYSPTQHAAAPPPWSSVLRSTVVTAAPQWRSRPPVRCRADGRA